MILSVNPEKKTTEMISIPRDTQAEIVGRDTTEKINHAYAYGGPDMAVKSIEKLMGVPIDHYATVNMDGLKDTIDTVGGIDVTSNATFNAGGINSLKVNVRILMVIPPCHLFEAVKKKGQVEISVDKKDNNWCFKV